MAKRLIQLALLIGALTGIFGQGLALAYIPGPAPSPAMQSSPDDCMKMMAQADDEKHAAPCKGLTLDCIAAMGCTLPLTLSEPFVLPASLPQPALAPATSIARTLTARVVAPEPEPPSQI